MYRLIIFTASLLLFLAWTSVSDATKVSCSPNLCPDYREKCFESTKTPNGYLCCSFSKAHQKWLYKNKTTTINCDPLRCYVCDSRIHQGCGSTFTYSDQEARDLGLSVVCENVGVTNAAACKKMVSTAYRSTIVTRTCFNNSQPNIEWHPNLCQDLSEVTSCYCTGHGCNGQEKNVIGAGVLLLSLIISVSKF